MASPEFGVIRIEGTQSIKHATQSAVADAANGKISSAAWNADHTAPPIPLFVSQPGLVWDTQPSSIRRSRTGSAPASAWLMAA